MISLVPGGRILWESSTQRDLPALQNAGITGTEFRVSKTEGTVFAASVLQNAPDTASDAMPREIQLVYSTKPTSMFSVIQKAIESIGWRITSVDLLGLTLRDLCSAPSKMESSLLSHPLAMRLFLSSA